MTSFDLARDIIKAHAEAMAALHGAPRDEIRLEGTKAMFALEEAIGKAILTSANERLEEAARGLAAAAAKGFDTSNPEIARLINVAMSEICDRILKEKD